MESSKPLNDLADELLLEFAKENKTSLRKLGVMSKRRFYVVHRREIPMSSLERRK